MCRKIKNRLRIIKARIGLKNQKESVHKIHCQFQRHGISKDIPRGEVFVIYLDRGLGCHGTF